MAFRSFVIPVFPSEWAERELSRFLQSHRVVSVERRFVEQGSESFWAVLVDHLASSVAVRDVPPPASVSGSKLGLRGRESFSAKAFPCGPSSPENDPRPGLFSLYLSRPLGLIPFLFLPRGERCPRLARGRLTFIAT